MKELVVRAGKYFSVGIICFACLPVLLPLLFLLSVFGFAFVLPLGSALAGFLYLRRYVGMLYRKLLTTLAGRCSSWGRQPLSSPPYFVDLPVSDLQAIETFESVDPEFDSVVVSEVLREGQRRSVEGANDPDIQSGLGAVSISDAPAFAVTEREGIDADPFVKDGTKGDDPSREDGTRKEGTDDDTANETSKENANSREVVDGDILAEDETTRDLIGDDTSADGGTKREGKDSTSVEDGIGRGGTGHVISEENESVRQANEDDTFAEDGTREEEKDEDTEDGSTREGKGDVTSEDNEPLRQVNENDTSAEDGTKEDEKDEDTSNENVSTREGTDEDTFAEVETSRDVREYDPSDDGGIQTDEKDSTSVEEATEEICQGTQIRGEEGETAFVKESELQEGLSAEVSGEEAGIPSQARDGYCQARGKEAEPTVEGDAQLQHLGRSKEFADEDASIGSNCSTSVPGDSPPSHDGQVGGKEAEPAVDEDGQLQPTGRSKDFSNDEDANNSISLHSDSRNSGHGNSHAIGVESVHEPWAERLTAADFVDDSSSRFPILDQREQQSEETSSGDYFGKGADDDLNNAAVVDTVEDGGLQTEEEEAPGDVGHDSLLIGALQQVVRENDKKSASSMVGAVHPDTVHDTHEDEGPTQPDGVRSFLPHQANEDDVWICKECGWKYPNAKPSAKIRRNHKKHCKGGTPPRTPAPEDGTLTERLSQSYEGVEKLRTDSKSSSPLANSSPKLTPIERTVNTESVLDGGGTFTRGVEANDLKSEHSTTEADLPTRSSAPSNSPSDVIQDEPESITGGPSAALAEEERIHSSPLRSKDDLSSPDHARLSEWVAFDDTGGAAVSSAESGGQDEESGVGSESFRSAANEPPSMASDSFRSVTDEFADKLSSVVSHGDNEQDQVAQVQHERQLSDDLDSVKGIVGDKYVSTGNLLIDIEELSGFLGIDLPPRSVEMSEIEWAKLAIEVMKVVVGID